MAANRALGVQGCSRALATADGRCVAIMANVEGDFGDVEEKKQAQLLRVAERWSGGHRLTPEQFNGNEGRARDGALSVMLQAFKTHKVRLYGIDIQIAGSRTFMIVDADIAKKRNKADPGRLKRAQDRALELVRQLQPGQTQEGKKR